jgi:hypothetical protein
MKVFRVDYTVHKLREFKGAIVVAESKEDVMRMLREYNNPYIDKLSNFDNIEEIDISKPNVVGTYSNDWD